MHLIQFDDFDASGRADGLNGFAIRLDPVVDGDMADLQESANRTEAETFKVKLERLPFGLRAYA